MQSALSYSTLDNGITLITLTNNSSDVIAGRIFLKNAGARWEQRTKAGLSQLLTSVITKGTEKLTALDLADKIESMGASLGADASFDYLLFSLKTVSSDFREILAIAAEIMRSPSFPTTEVELEKQLTQQNIRSQQESPFNVAFSQLREAIYRDHPYSLSVLGTETTLATLSEADLKAYHQLYFRPDQLVISLSGRLEPEIARNWVEETFGDWKNPPMTPQILDFPLLISKPETRSTHQNTQQAIVMLGYLTPGVKSPEYPIFKVLTTYLGNGLSSRLFVELREKRGLAYDVSAFYPTRLDQSNFTVYMGTAPENAAIAQEGLRSEVDRLCTTPLSETEMQVAKNKLLGQYALGKQANGEIAQIYGWYETLGLGINYDLDFPDQINAVTSEQVQEVAQTYLTEPYISLVGPESAIYSSPKVLS
ncbi:pitrilysin family protein [Gloeocapsa sp. PCC 73106]|uniref:M16 family metallopeptidase n=1 Tax=Gloeocapsa sp. PCC 73106 TaxID=102232 RepID=UPI0002ABE188|nr:pitrilysin family protein [Gloeocapsa sp. PCC 73106]ELR97441.1 putative Zn-dependent peptidase [Gloeocapsa sp. PCC 73106]